MASRLMNQTPSSPLMRELLAARQSYTLGGDEIRARARIGVQPAARTIRFRYPCEGRSAGSIHGAKTTTTGADRRTFPSIVVDNYVGRVVVVASCVTDAKPHCAHPNNLVGQDCLSGVYIKKQQVLADRNELTISHLGIQCVRKADVQKSLDKRRMQGFDPYKTGFDYDANRARLINLHALRICFQVFIDHPDPKTGRSLLVALPPLLSDTVYDKKSKIDLTMHDISDDSGPCTGSQKLIILCDKVTKEDIAVRFFELADVDADAIDTDGVCTKDDYGRKRRIVWWALADMKPTGVHKQVAMVLLTPAYGGGGGQALQQAVQVFVQLYRPSDGATSQPMRFVYRPTGKRKNKIQRNRRKKRKINGGQPDTVEAPEVFGTCSNDDSGFVGTCNDTQQYAPDRDETNSSDESCTSDDDDSTDELIANTQRNMGFGNTAAANGSSASGRMQQKCSPTQQHQQHQHHHQHQARACAPITVQPQQQSQLPQQPQLSSVHSRLHNTQVQYTDPSLTIHQQQQPNHQLKQQRQPMWPLNHQHQSQMQPPLQVKLCPPAHQQQSLQHNHHQQQYQPKTSVYTTYNMDQQHQQQSESANHAPQPNVAQTPLQPMLSQNFSAALPQPLNVGHSVTFNNRQSMQHPKKCTPTTQQHQQQSLQQPQPNRLPNTQLQYIEYAQLVNQPQPWNQQQPNGCPSAHQQLQLQSQQQQYNQQNFSQTAGIQQASSLPPNYGHSAAINQSPPDFGKSAIIYKTSSLPQHFGQTASINIPPMQAHFGKSPTNNQPSMLHNIGYSANQSQSSSTLQHQQQQPGTPHANSQQPLFSKSSVQQQQHSKSDHSSNNQPMLQNMQHQHQHHNQHLDMADSYGTTQQPLHQQAHQLAQSTNDCEWSAPAMKCATDPTTAAMHPMEQQQPSRPEHNLHQPQQQYQPHFNLMVAYACGPNDINYPPSLG